MTYDAVTSYSSGASALKMNMKITTKINSTTLLNYQLSCNKTLTTAFSIKIPCSESLFDKKF